MIKVIDIMSREAITIGQNTSIKESVDIMISKVVSSLIVMEKGVPIAVITENDIVKGIVSKKGKVKDIMTKDFMIVSPKTRFSEISKILRSKKVKRFPVMDGNDLVGIITETDIIEATRDFTRFHQIMQEIILAVFGLATAFFLFYFSQLGTALFG